MKLLEKLKGFRQDTMYAVLKQEVERAGVIVEEDGSLMRDWAWGQFQVRVLPYSTVVEFERIVIDLKKLKAAAKVVVLAHEYGHALDFRERLDRDAVAWYTAVMDPDSEVQLEQYAWRNATRTLIRMNYEDWQYYYKIVRAAYKSYVDQLDLSKEDALKMVETLLDELRAMVSKEPAHA